LTLLVMSTGLLETCRESKEIYVKGIVRQVGYLLELDRAEAVVSAEYWLVILCTKIYFYWLIFFKYSPPLFYVSLNMPVQTFSMLRG